MSDELPIDKAVQNLTKPETEEGATDQEAGRNQNPPPGIPLIGAQINPRQPEPNQTNSSNKAPFPWKLAAEITGFIAGIILLAINICQLYEVHQTRIIDERAWVTPYITDNNLIIFTNGQVEVRIDVKNSGRTPAILTGFGIKAFEDTNDFPTIDKVNKISMIASPNADNIRLFSGIPTKEIQDLISKNSFYIYGVITYQDIFKQDHWTEFCWSVVGGDFNAAPFHNGWGDIENQQKK
jgi:hypothetical protein